MGIELPIVVYTHTDMKDTWEMFFGQLKKYLPNNKVYVAVNETDTNLSDYIQIIYNDSNPYTDRWKEILPQIAEETILFLHEDMVLFDEVKLDYIERYYNLVNSDKVESVKLIYTNTTNPPSDIDSTLIQCTFSIQPTLINRKNFVSLLDSVPPLNIWEFESAIQSNGNHYMVKIGGEKQRGMYHCDSIVFPYIATAINKGKWNMSEYQKELDKMFKEYGVIPFNRGIV